MRRIKMIHNIMFSDKQSVLKNAISLSFTLDECKRVQGLADQKPKR